MEHFKDCIVNAEMRDITKRMDIKCSRCRRIIGDTDDPTRTVDLCAYCKTQWKAELLKEQNLLRDTMSTFHMLMAKEPVHPAMKIRRVK